MRNTSKRTPDPEGRKLAQSNSKSEDTPSAINHQFISTHVGGSKYNPEPPQDTSLDDILAILDDHHSIVTDELGKSCAKELLAWHKAEIAKLLAEIERLKNEA